MRWTSIRSKIPEKRKTFHKKSENANIIYKHGNENKNKKDEILEYQKITISRNKNNNNGYKVFVADKENNEDVNKENKYINKEIQNI